MNLLHANALQLNTLFFQLIFTLFQYFCLPKNLVFRYKINLPSCVSDPDVKNEDIGITVPTLLEVVYVVIYLTTECVLEKRCLPVERAL